MHTAMLTNWQPAASGVADRYVSFGRYYESLPIRFLPHCSPLPFPATVAPAPRRHRLRRDGLSSVDISREYNRCGTEKSPRGIPAIQHR